ncbi:MAG: 16S rRNA processing protein RimM [Balneola sp.]|nr:MAG: 16S rRNA processing protein RimM [Balneola sp.]
MNQDALTSPFVQVGHVVKSQGLKGELKVHFDSINPNAIEQISMVYMRNDRGDFFPSRLSGFRIEEKGNKPSFFVQFDQIADRSSADAMKNKALFIERKEAEKFFNEHIEEPSFIDFEVVHEDNAIGYVDEVIDNGAQQLLSIASSKGALLVPIVDEYIVNIDAESGTIYCKNLGRLIEL